jgi:hypothetical protein
MVTICHGAILSLALIIRLDRSGKPLRHPKASFDPAFSPNTAVNSALRALLW